MLARSAFSIVGLACLAACNSKPRSESKPGSPWEGLSTAPSAKAPLVAKPASAVVETRADVRSLVGDADKLYWLSGGYTGMPKGLLVAPKTGGAPTKLADVKDQNGVWVTSSNVYFMDGGELFVVGKDGGTPASFAKAEMLGPAGASGETFCWMAGGAPKLEDAKPVGGVQRKTITEAGDVNLFCKKDSGKMVARAQATPMVLPGPLLVSGDEVFWTSSEDKAVLSSPTGGGRKTTVASDVTNVTALAANSSSLFMVATREDKKGVYAVERKGGTPKLLAPITAPVAMDLAADGSNVYYAVKGGLFSVPAAGGAPTALFDDAYQEPQGLVVDGSTVFLAIGVYVHRLKKPPNG